jgi:hypothetical protein
MEWIEGNGGYVHPNLRHDRIRQIVHLGDDDDDDNDDDDDDNNDYVGGGTRTTSAAVVAALFDAGSKILGTPAYVGKLGIILRCQKNTSGYIHRYHTFISKASLNPSAKKYGMIPRYLFSASAKYVCARRSLLHVKFAPTLCLKPT